MSLDPGEVKKKINISTVSSVFNPIWKAGSTSAALKLILGSLYGKYNKI